MKTVCNIVNTLEDLKQFGYDINNMNKSDWERISCDLYLSEDFIREFANKINWYWISIYQKLSESFIREFKDKVNWHKISTYQKLSESFIREYKDYVNWRNISMYQKLSEPFIKEFKDYVDWVGISRSQKLSESFIREFQDCVDWIYISRSQKLSEKFIEGFKDYVNWYWISIYQKLSEPFIRKFKNMVRWINISKYQDLSEDFIEEFTKLGKITNDYKELIKDSWYYKTSKYKEEQVIKTNLYECYDDYFIAYKGIRSDNYSKFNFQYQYFVGNTYESNADHSDNENSFGLSAWTLDDAKEYCDEKIIKVKIKYKDIARVVHNGGKIRCCKFEVLEEIE